VILPCVVGFMGGIAFDGGDDVLVRGPCEGLWGLFCLGDEAVDGDLQIDDGSETPRFNRRLDSLAKYPSTAFKRSQIIPGAAFLNLKYKNA